MRVHPLALAGVAVLAAAAACGGSSSGGSGSASGSGSGPVQHPKELVGDVGHNDGFSISLKDENGAAISNIVAGNYKLTVHDESGIHDFHLSGGGVDKATTVPGTGTTTFTVAFTPGTYTFVCDPHSSSMHGRFTVS